MQGFGVGLGLGLIFARSIGLSWCLSLLVGLSGLCILFQGSVLWCLRPFFGVFFRVYNNVLLVLCVSCFVVQI